jgi:hypothetical protein
MRSPLGVRPPLPVGSPYQRYPRARTARGDASSSDAAIAPVPCAWRRAGRSGLPARVRISAGDRAAAAFVRQGQPSRVRPASSSWLHPRGSGTLTPSTVGSSTPQEHQSRRGRRKFPLSARAPRRSRTAASKHNCLPERAEPASAEGRSLSLAGEAALCCRRHPRVAILLKRSAIVCTAGTRCGCRAKHRVSRPLYTRDKVTIPGATISVGESLPGPPEPLSQGQRNRPL